MAGRLILMKNTERTISGTCEAEGYENWLQLDTLAFGASAHHQRDQETGSAHQTGVQITLPFGPWVAEMQQALYHGWRLGHVEICEVDQKIDPGGKKVWKKVREIMLVNGWIETMSHGWSGIQANVSVTLQYTDMEFKWVDKVAVFHRNEKT